MLDSSRIADLWCDGLCRRSVIGYHDDWGADDVRGRAVGRGWVCDETGDWCPRCQAAANIRPKTGSDLLQFPSNDGAPATGGTAPERDQEVSPDGR